MRFEVARRSGGAVPPTLGLPSVGCHIRVNSRREGAVALCGWHCGALPRAPSGKWQTPAMDPLGIGALAFLLWCLLSFPAGMLLGRCLRYGRTGPPPLVRIPGQRRWDQAARPLRVSPRRVRAGSAPGVRRAMGAAGLVAGVSVVTMSAAAGVQSSLSPARTPPAVHRVLDILTPFSADAPPPSPTAEPQQPRRTEADAATLPVQPASDAPPMKRHPAADAGVGVWLPGASAVVTVPEVLLPEAPVAAPPAGPVLAADDATTTPGGAPAVVAAPGPAAAEEAATEVAAADPHRPGTRPEVPAAVVEPPADTPGSDPPVVAAAPAPADTATSAVVAAPETPVDAVPPAEAPADTSTPAHTGAPPPPGPPDHAGRPDDPGRPDHAGRPGLGRPGSVNPPEVVEPEPAGTTDGTSSEPAPTPTTTTPTATATTGSTSPTATPTETGVMSSAP